MKEIDFLHKNIKKWKEFESLLEDKENSNPDRLFNLYISLTDDLAYAKTYYPGGEAYYYLNQLTQKVHGLIYQNKPIERKSIGRFLAYELPLVFHSLRKEFYVALAIFIVSVLVGILSTAYKPEFVKTILGDRYVNMTMENIRSGDPMGVYKSANELPMFLGITINNIRVAFFAFVLGIFTSFGTGYMLFTNGVMLGTFQTFMIQNGVVLDSFATIWIHGTIEIFSIIVAGAAGIAIGNSFIFPGTYSRVYALKQAAIKGAKLAIGLVPFFIVAGFLEGFMTRHTEVPYWIRFTIIGLSLVWIIFYFFIYPRLLIRKTYNYATQ
ncbi:stage II sporulation protein M [Saccharicrinis sp. FJH2]|uniref:stage II sporulation protein M n=1 Tax=unclassified Saccharicrinis TaxID=2646859 RepID=UPI0035D46875